MTTANDKSPGDESEPGTSQTGTMPCATCQGTGTLQGSECPDCEGSGQVTVIVGDA